jgi:hypothetical protein
MAHEKQVYEAILQVCGDQGVKSTVTMIYAMFEKSADTEQCARTELRNTRSIDGCVKLAAAYVRAKVPGVYNPSNLFTSNPRVFESLAEVVGRKKEDWTPVALGNYMRVGMAAIARVYAESKLGAGGGEPLKEYIAERLLGDKPYPRMVWADGDVPTWLMAHGAENVEQSCTALHLGEKWTPPSQRSISGIVDHILIQFHEEDFYGRGRLRPWQQGSALLKEYSALTKNRDADRIHRYHFEHFWSILLRAVKTQKRWDKWDKGKDDAASAYLLTKNVPVIIEKLQPDVPWHVQNALTEDTVRRLVREAPPRPPEYQQQLLPEKVIMTNVLASWHQAGFMTVTAAQLGQLQAQVGQLAGQQAQAAMEAAIRRAGLQEFSGADGVTYQLGTVLMGGAAARYRPK